MVRASSEGGLREKLREIVQTIRQRNVFAAGDALAG
jgi:hypothetical protein